MKPESSATTMRGLRTMVEGSVVPAAAGLGGRGELDLAEQAVEVEQDDQAVAELHDPLDGVRAGGRDRVELLVLDRQDLLDVVHDDARGDRAALDDDDLLALGVTG